MLRNIKTLILKNFKKKKEMIKLSDINEDDFEIIKQVKPYSMTTQERIYSLIQSIKYVVQNEIPGDIVECGVWKGGSVMAAALMLIKLGDINRELYLFDTFEGMTKPGKEDTTGSGTPALNKFNKLKITDKSSEWCNASLNEVKANVYTTGYDNSKIHFIKGMVEDSIPQNAPKTIALLRLDTDWYESTRHELTHLFPRLSNKGIIIIDDYGRWKGSKKATDEYFLQNKIGLFLHRIDSSGCIAVKI